MKLSKRAFLPAIGILWAGLGLAQTLQLVTEIKLHTDPEDARVRPYETVVVQVLAYGEVTENGETRTVRLRQDGANVKIKESNAGWLSKPFRYQGQENEPFYEREQAGLAAVIFGRARSQLSLQDAVLYTAPERPGGYTIEAELNGKTASVTIRVDPSAPPRGVAEKISFPKEAASRDPFRRLAEHYAPFVAQETWFQPKSDYLARFDFDGDWKGDNNWNQMEEGSSQAYVHYAVMETSTHWFLIYNLFHPRDYSDKCVAGTCHENDNEGLILTVQKDGSSVGRLLTMETLAHNNIYSYLADRRVRGNVHNPDGDVELYEGSHPVIFVESGGHGIYGSTDHHSRFLLRDGEFAEGTGVTYIYKGVAERPKHANDRNVGYELLPIYDYWWVRAHGGDGRGESFDEYFVYQPFGNRPRPPTPEIAGSFLGREYGSNKAKPFWGWHDERTRKRDVLNTGQWGLDPAYAVSRNLRMPDPFSLDYTFNPYLGIGTAPRGQLTEGHEATVPAPAPETAENRAPSGGAAAGLRQFHAQRSSDHDLQSKQGQFDLRLVVDGEAEVFIQENTVRYKTLNGRPPVDDGSQYTQPLPRAPLREFDIDKKDGRGDVKLLEPPAAANDYTAKLFISDRKGGDDRYHVRLEWEAEEGVSAAPAPRETGGGIFAKHLEPFLLEKAPLPDAEPAPAADPNLPAGVELHSGANDPGNYREEHQGKFEFRGAVDGEVIVRIQNDRVFAETLSGRPLALERFVFSQPLPNARVGEIKVDKKDGRGEVTLLERPWEGNNYQAAVRISDPKGSDDRYHFVLEWKR